MSEDKKIKIVVKTPKERHDFEVDVNAQATELKRQVCEKFGTSLDRICLIFAGKIIKDEDTLASHHIQEGLTIHLVIRNAENPSSPNSGPEAKTQVIGSLSSAFECDIFNQMHNELLANPSQMMQILNNPLVQRLLHNPEHVQQMMNLIHNNTQLRELMERNPEIAHLFNNPQIFRESLELARNPTMMQELMRTNDRALLNLESIPGGMNVLERDYRDIHEPLIEAASEQNNPYITSSRNTNSPSSEHNPQRGIENRTPLPNPWGSGSGETVRSTPSPEETSPLDIENVLASIMSGNPSPQLTSILMSPRAVEALNQIRQGIEQLRNVISEANPNNNTNQSESSPTRSPNNDYDLMMATVLADLQNTNISSGNVYQSQLEQLNSMGFTDEQANLQALAISFGNLEAAVNWLLENRESLPRNNPEPPSK